MKKKILITGGAGFVGKNLLKNLEKEKSFDIRILTRNRKTKDKQALIGDLKDYNSIKDLFKGIDIVINLAYSKDYHENIPLIKNLLNACYENKTKKLIHLSSMSAKRDFPDEYGKNKLEIENLIRDSKLKYTILRPSIIYGKGSTSFNFLLHHLRKIPFFVPIIGSGKYALFPIHVKDVSDSIKQCILHKKTDNKEYDIVGKEKVYFIDLINLLKKEVKINKPNLHIPIFFFKIIALLFPKIISKENLKNLTQDSLANIEPAKKDFNYNPIKFDEGIKNGLI